MTIFAEMIHLLLYYLERFGAYTYEICHQLIVQL